jgi:L-alanine-DL-glutamate epimerase-like enolase superfamily enzyme
MIITDVRATIIHVPFTHPYIWTFGSMQGATSLIIQISTDENIVGIGEGTCPFYPNISPDISKLIVDSSRHLILNENPFDIEKIMRKLYGFGWHFTRHMANSVFGGVEMALWDIVGKTCKRPLYQLFGGCLRKEIPFFGFVFRDNLEAMVSESRKYVEDGFKTLYLKVGVDEEEELEQLGKIRDAVGYSVALRLDANEAWTPGAAIRFIKKMERFEPEFIEQPVSASDLEGMIRVRNAVDVPILADQSSRTLSEASNVVRRGAADALSTSPLDAEGIAGCRKVAAVTEAAGLPVIMHSNVETGLATASFLQIIASTANFLYANQTELPHLSGDILKEDDLKFENGCLEIPDKPGLGVELDWDKVRKYADIYIKSNANQPTKPESFNPTPRTPHL